MDRPLAKSSNYDCCVTAAAAKTAAGDFLVAATGHVTCSAQAAAVSADNCLPHFKDLPSTNAIVDSGN